MVYYVCVWYTSGASLGPAASPIYHGQHDNTTELGLRYYRLLSSDQRCVASRFHLPFLLLLAIFPNQELFGDHLLPVQQLLVLVVTTVDKVGPP